MRYVFFLAVPLLMFTWMACSDSKTNATTEIAPGTTNGDSIVQNQIVPSVVDTNKSLPIVTAPIITSGLNPAHGQPGHRCDIAVGAPLDSKPVTAPVISPTIPVTSPTTTTIKPGPVVSVTTVAPGMNPSHGQPGHRCDIAVGAPLDSKPGQQPAKTTSIPLTTQATVPAPITKVAPGMNPAHGQPGHRCDIAVGAPLDSKPGQQPVQTTSIPLTTQATVPAPTTKVAPGMNPAHGQPGHRCDIAVGAPLNSKPVTDPNATIKTQAIPLVTPIKSLPDTNGKHK